MKLKLWFFFIAFNCSLLAPSLPWGSLIYAQWFTTPDTALVIAYGYEARIVSDGGGGAIVAFQNQNTVKAKRVNQYGELQWNGRTGVYVGGTGLIQGIGDIAEDGRGGVIVAFTDEVCIDRCNGPDPLIVSYVTVQRIDHWGNKLWGNGIRVTSVDTTIQTEPKIESDGNGGCLVGWMDTRNNKDSINPYGNDIYVQKIDSNGNRCWGDSAIKISKNINPYCYSIMLFKLSGSKLYLMWDEEGYRIQKIDEAGHKLWSDTGRVFDHVPWHAAIPNGNEGLILGGTISSISPGYYRVACQQIDSSGNKLWGEAGVLLIDTINYKSQVSNIILLYDTLYISYYHNKLARWDFFVQKISLDGIKHFGENGLLVSSYPSSKSGNMLRSDDSLLLIWNDGRGGVYGQKLDLYGNRLWTDDKLFYLKKYFGIITDNKGGAILLCPYWEDFSIRLTKVDMNGNIGQVVDVNDEIEKEIFIKDFVLYQNYPNPFNSSTTIEYHLKKPAYVELGIYNMLGQKIKTPIHSYQNSGNYRMHLDMAGYSSGVYIYRLKTNKQTETRKFLYVK